MIDTNNIDSGIKYFEILHKFKFTHVTAIEKSNIYVNIKFFAQDYLWRPTKHPHFLSRVSLCVVENSRDIVLTAIYTDNFHDDASSKGYV